MATGGHSRNLNKKSQRSHSASHPQTQHSDEGAEGNSAAPTDYCYGGEDWEAEGAAQLRDLVEKVWPAGTEVYQKQQYQWPSNGKHIKGVFDDNSIVVYQAFCPAIADSAVKDQKFGGGGFSFSRMSWIKTNFLWMMYRCGWCTKHNQERVLAVRITLEGFQTILANAYTAQLKLPQNSDKLHDEVRLQWDPDHSPVGGKLTRRAIQLGLKDNILKRYSDDWIVSIHDVTPFVRYQHRIMKERGQHQVSTPREHVYTPPSHDTRRKIGLDEYVTSEAQLVS